MGPFLISFRKMLHAGRAFTGFVVQAEAGMFHLAALLHEEADQRVLRHGGDLAFPKPVGTVVPLAGGTLALDIDPCLVQAPVRKAPAVEAADVFPAGEPFTARTGFPAAVQDLAFADDGRMIFPRPTFPVRRGTELSPGAKDVRSVDAKERGAPGDPPFLRAGGFPPVNQGRDIFSSIQNIFLHLKISFF